MTPRSLLRGYQLPPFSRRNWAKLGQYQVLQNWEDRSSQSEAWTGQWETVRPEYGTYSKTTGRIYRTEYFDTHGGRAQMGNQRPWRRQLYLPWKHRVPTTRVYSGIIHKSTTYEASVPQKPTCYCIHLALRSVPIHNQLPERDSNPRSSVGTTEDGTRLRQCRQCD